MRYSNTYQTISYHICVFIYKKKQITYARFMQVITAESFKPREVFSAKVRISFMFRCAGNFYHHCRTGTMGLDSVHDVSPLAWQSLFQTPTLAMTLTTAGLSCIQNIGREKYFCVHNSGKVVSFKQCRRQSDWSDYVAWSEAISRSRIHIEHVTWFRNIASLS
jgi:hypothetical protein